MTNDNINKQIKEQLERQMTLTDRQRAHRVRHPNDNSNPPCKCDVCADLKARGVIA